MGFISREIDWRSATQGKLFKLVCRRLIQKFENFNFTVIITANKKPIENKIMHRLLVTKEVVIFKAAYRGRRSFGGVPIF